jgi:hypothetical protein
LFVKVVVGGGWCAWRVNTSPEVVLLPLLYQTKPHIRATNTHTDDLGEPEAAAAMGSLFSRSPAAASPSCGREKVATEVDGLPLPSGSTMGALGASSAPRPALASDDERACPLPGLPAACLETTNLARFLSDTWFRLLFLSAQTPACGWIRRRPTDRCYHRYRRSCLLRQQIRSGHQTWKSGHGRRRLRPASRRPRRLRVALVPRSGCATPTWSTGQGLGGLLR